MCITEGVDRGRMSYDKVNETRAWKCSFLFTGEEPCIKQASGGGAKNRVIEVECKDKIIANGNAVANFVRTHFGCPGEPYIEQIKKEDVSEWYKNTFAMIIDSTDTTDKQAGAMALMLVADTIASSMFWPEEKTLSVCDVKGYLSSASEVDVVERAYHYVRNAIAENVSCFSKDARQAWGSLTDGCAYINKNVLCRIMDEVGFDFDAVKAKWAERDYLVRGANGRYLHYKSINGAQAYYVQISLESTTELEDFDGEVPF